MESRKGGSFGPGFKVTVKCAGQGGNSSSIAAKKEKSKPKAPTSGIFAAKKYVYFISIIYKAFTYSNNYDI